ncbi:HelD family protein [Streptomonospora nanhaiensis]|uniref:HelD family protein n=1 Tax=Streptomonospora nanhaiensis TaxID=1323731 RepID=UPI001C38EF40|nr:ATP-binding domain-containing protein [Streptomonospora nanhaiensis]MBV2367031.1 AAA family ATPase [Streptomonospora nanhaiensis]
MEQRQTDQVAEQSPAPQRPSHPSPGRGAALRTEQDHVDRVYARLDVLRERAASALTAALARGGAGGYAALMEREVTVAEQAARAARLSAVENGLCFGRIDHAPDHGGDTLYIGRIGIRDDDHESLLVDWRAPAARPFYSATPVSPDGLVRRRHLHMRDRAVTGVDDEVFDLDGLSDSDRRTLVGEAALLAGLRRGRTGRMRDIVATIQTEQDRVIRSDLAGVLVVQGGPGTGKTVAALHRAAYLLYTHRAVLERRGVLVVGPNPAFLRYIGEVLPSLGETDVVLRTVGELFPGVAATAQDPPETAVVKGSLRMTALVEAAVADRQRVPGEPGGTGPGSALVVAADGMRLRVPAAVCRSVRDRARALPLPHNMARKLVVNRLLEALARDQARQLDRPADEADLRYTAQALWQEEPVRRAIDGLWPHLTPQELVGRLLADRAVLERVGARAGLTESERAALHRPAGGPWTVGDVPLLDEAAELLGADNSADLAAERADRRRRADEERYAQGVLEYTGLFEDGLMAADTLAERQRGAAPAATTAERAAADREWAYGHVIVDEAQELSEMAWRVVMRRVPTRSLTVVGDTAQTGSPAGARSWSGMLGRYANGRLREQRLLVNYRTPAPIMAVAADVLAEAAPGERAPESVRAGGDPPRAVRVADTDLPARLPKLVAEELAAIGEGRVAVIAPPDRHTEVAALLPAAAADAGPGALDAAVAVLTPGASKGLEFDSVVVVDPVGVAASSAAGGRDLYVALTRATRRLTVVHEGPLPPMLRRLREEPA